MVFNCFWDPKLLFNFIVKFKNKWCYKVYFNSDKLWHKESYRGINNTDGLIVYQWMISSNILW